MRKNRQRFRIFVMSLVFGSVFAAPGRGDGLTDNHWILRKKRDGGSLWLVDKKKQPVMEIEGGARHQVESIPAGSVMDPALRPKLQRYSLGAKREVDESKSLSLSTQDHYGIVIDKTMTTPEMPDYARTNAERTAHPWPNGVNLDQEFAGYHALYPGSTTIQVTVFNREGKTVFSKQYSGSSARADIDDSQSPAWIQLYLGVNSQPQLIELIP